MVFTILLWLSLVPYSLSYHSSTPFSSSENGSFSFFLVCFDTTLGAWIISLRSATVADFAAKLKDLCLLHVFRVAVKPLSLYLILSVLLCQRKS